MSDAVVLALVAMALVLVVAGMFRLLGVLDLAELTLRRLVAEIRATRKTVGAAGELASAVERDATQGQAALDRLEDLKRGRPQP